MSQRRRRPSARRPRGHPNGDGAGGPDGRAVGGAGAVAAGGQAGRAVVEVDEAAAHRWDQVAGADGGAVAGCAGGLRISYLESDLPVILSGTVSPVAEERRWRSYLRRNGPSLGGMSWRPGGCGSGSIWGGRRGRS